MYMYVSISHWRSLWEIEGRGVVRFVFIFEDLIHKYCENELRTYFYQNKRGIAYISQVWCSIKNSVVLKKIQINIEFYLFYSFSSEKFSAIFSLYFTVHHPAIPYCIFGILLSKIQIHDSHRQILWPFYTRTFGYPSRSWPWRPEWAPCRSCTTWPWARGSPPLPPPAWGSGPRPQSCPPGSWWIEVSLVDLRII